MILFAMPTSSAPSELWMQRMLCAVQDRVHAVAAYELPDRGALRLPGDGIPVHVNLGRRADPGSIEEGKQSLRRLLHSGRVDVILAHYIPFALRYEEVFLEANIPLFIHAHGYDLTWDLQRDGRAFHAATYVEDVRRISNRATLVVNSHQSAQKLLDIGVQRQRVCVKYLGVPIPAEHTTRAVSPGRLDCLYLGRLVDFKGPLETLRAFELAAEGGLEGELTFAGDGPLMPELRQAVGASPIAGRVRILGVVSAEEGEALRLRHQVFVSHSQVGPISRQEEAFGVSYVEALAAGLPVVSASGGSLSEIVIHNQTGLLSTPGDVIAQARNLVHLSREPGLYERLSVGAHADARRRFSTETERSALLSLLEQRVSLTA